jgi:mevalonate kinase
MNLKDLQNIENQRELTNEEKQLKKILEKEAKLLDDLQKAKDRKKQINEKLNKKRTHNLIVVASTLLKGISAEDLERLKDLAENNEEELKRVIREKVLR